MARAGSIFAMAMRKFTNGSMHAPGRRSERTCTFQACRQRPAQTIRTYSGCSSAPPLASKLKISAHDPDPNHSFDNAETAGATSELHGNHSRSGEQSCPVFYRGSDGNFWGATFHLSFLCRSVHPRLDP